MTITTTNKAGAAITYDDKGEARSFTGRDAVNVYAAAVVRSAIGLKLKGINATRGVTVKGLIARASQITGNQYKSGKAGMIEAQADLATWITRAKETFVALPVPSPV